MSKPLRLRGAAWGLCVALILVGHAMAQDELDQVPQRHYTQDPIGDVFVGIFDSTESAEVHYWPPLLLIVPIDLNLDGRLNLLVSANYYRNGRQGEVSQIFIREDQGYRDLRRPIVPGKSNSTIDFNYGAARIRQNPETNSVSFFDLSTGGGGDCVLYETRISSTTVEFRRIAELQAQDEEDFARTRSWRYLFEPLEPRIRYMNFGYLQIHYAARLHREPMEEERRASYSSPVPIDYRDPAQADKFFDSLEDAYTLLDGMTAGSVSGPLEQAPDFDNVQVALEYYMKRNAPTWKPAPVEKLVPKFGEEALIAALEPMSSNLNSR